MKHPIILSALALALLGTSVPAYSSAQSPQEQLAVAKQEFAELKAVMDRKQQLYGLAAERQRQAKLRKEAFPQDAAAQEEFINANAAFPKTKREFEEAREALDQSSARLDALEQAHAPAEQPAPAQPAPAEPAPGPAQPAPAPVQPAPAVLPPVQPLPPAAAGPNINLSVEATEAQAAAAAKKAAADLLAAQRQEEQRVQRVKQLRGEIADNEMRIAELLSSPDNRQNIDEVREQAKTNGRMKAFADRYDELHRKVDALRAENAAKEAELRQLGE